MNCNNIAKENSLDKESKGRLLIFSAPSGSGKSTIVQWLMKEHPELNMHIMYHPCTSRNRAEWRGVFLHLSC